ncbi:MAG: sulfatase-like hydrolase/transferase [Myxococcota bacterium]
MADAPLSPGRLGPVDLVRWWVALAGLLLAPRIGPMIHPGRVTVLPDACVLLVVGWALGQVGAPPRSRWPSWRAWLLAVPWAAAGVFEAFRAALRYATNEELPVYDGVLLSKHLYVLARDLYGGWAPAAVVALALSPFAITAVGAVLFGELERVGRRAGPVGGAVMAAAPALLALGSAWMPKAWWTAEVAAVSVQRSFELFDTVRRELATRSHAELEGITLERRPDVVFYIVESYGRVVEQDPDYAAKWAPEVDASEARLRERGWSFASTWMVAPVHGGRSWIADTSLLLGVRVQHQSDYEHVLSLVDRRPSLVTFFERQGYTSVLVKPTDRERPGVALENPFGFDRTVFAVDLDYEGPIVGWGQIPDQYTIEYVQENLLDAIDAPRFAFFHLATAHLPWTPAPPLVQHWSEWATMTGADRPVFETRSLKSEIAMRMSRFKRKLDVDSNKKVRSGDDYLADVQYDLAAIEQRLSSPYARPTVVIVMGDHQPPVVAKDLNDDVPLHVLANDPRLLEPLIAAGFTPTYRPRGATSTLEHRDLYPLLAHTLDEAAP